MASAKQGGNTGVCLFGNVQRQALPLWNTEQQPKEKAVSGGYQLSTGCNSMCVCVRGYQSASARKQQYRGGHWRRA